VRYSSRFWLYAPLALFLILAGGAMAHWWVVASAFDKKLNALNGHEAVPGITLSYTGKTISGFPFNLDVVFTGFKISGAGTHGPFAWTSEHFALHALTYGRAQHIYEAAGQQSLSWSDGSGKAHHIEFLPATLHASAIVDGRGLSQFDLEAVGLGGSGAAPFTIEAGQFHLRRGAGNTVDLMLSADNAKTADGVIQRLRVYVSLTHGEIWARALAGKSGWPETYAAWRQAGGAAQMAKRDIAPAGGAVAAADILNSIY